MSVEVASRKTTDSWLAELDAALYKIAETLRKVVLEAVPDIREAIKWGNPTYEKNWKVCYVSATNGYVSLGFFNGASLTDPEGRIEGTGKKMRHIKVRRLEDIKPEQYASWVREAVALNQRASV